MNGPNFHRDILFNLRRMHHLVYGVKEYWMRHVWDWSDGTSTVEFVKRVPGKKSLKISRRGLDITV
jgi:hypothetical protein